MEQLKERYGGILTDSIIGGIFADNPEGAVQVLDEIANQNPGLSEATKNRMVEDFHAQFKVLF